MRRRLDEASRGRAHPVTLIAFVLAIVFLAGGLKGCGIKETAKRVEGELYNLTAESVSQYCKEVCDGNATKSLFVSEERRQAREEIQERGTNGQLSPWGTSGPVVALWCECDTPVPDAVWEYVYDDERPR